MSARTMKGPQPFVVLGSQRSGSTMLCYALDSHPDIYCDRTEPTHRFHPLRRFGVTDADTVRLSLTVHGYQASGGKIMDNQLLMLPEVPEVLLEHRVRVIRLTRNKVRQAVSILVDGAAKAAHLHVPKASFGRVPPHTVALAPEAVVKQYRDFAYWQRWVDAWLEWSGLDSKPLSYEQLVGDQTEIDELPPEIAESLCAFLGVSSRPLEVPLRRINLQPLPELVSNWAEVCIALRNEGVIPPDDLAPTEGGAWTI